MTIAISVIVPQRWQERKKGENMNLVDFSKDIGNFKLSVSGDVVGNDVRTEIQGRTIAVIGGMILLTKHVSELIKNKDSHLYMAFMMAMLDAMKGDFPDGKEDKGVEFKDESNNSTVAADIKPDGMPNQNVFDSVLDKILGEKRS